MVVCIDSYAYAISTAAASPFLLYEKKIPATQLKMSTPQHDPLLHKNILSQRRYIRLVAHTLAIRPVYKNKQKSPEFVIFLKAKNEVQLMHETSYRTLC